MGKMECRTELRSILFGENDGNQVFASVHFFVRIFLQILFAKRVFVRVQVYTRVVQFYSSHLLQGSGVFMTKCFKTNIFFFWNFQKNVRFEERHDKNTQDLEENVYFKIEPP